MAGWIAVDFAAEAKVMPVHGGRKKLREIKKELVTMPHSISSVSSRLLSIFSARPDSESVLRRFKLNGNRLTILVFVAIIAFLTFRAPAKTWFGKTAPVRQSGAFAVQGQASATPKQVPTHFESELITIRPEGFEPTQITRPKGNFFLLVENRSGLTSVTLRLDCLSGGRLVEAPVARELLDRADLLNLTPGDYTVTEANHPNWVCHITITP